MRWSVVVAGLVICRAAGASPLEPLWDVPFTGNCDSSVFVLDGQLAMLREDKLVPIDRATGALGAPRTLKMTRPNVQHGRSWGTPGTAEELAGVLVVRGGGWIGGFDPNSGAELWSSDRGSVLQQPEPRQAALIVEDHPRDDLGSAHVTLEVRDPRTGVARWQTRLLGESQQFHNLTADAARAYAITTPKLNTRTWFVTAVELATGKVAWIYQLDATADGEPAVVAADAGVVLEAPGEGLRVLEPATGRLRVRIATPTLKAVAVSGARVIAALVTKQGDFNAHEIAAYDLATGAQQWRRPLELVSGLLVVDGRYAFVRVFDELHALDLATGADATPWTMADQDLIYVHDDASAPAAILCGGGRMIALDPSGPPRVLETATIEATISCRGCSKTNPAPKEVYVNGDPVKLSGTRLRAQVTARGQVHVHAELGDMRAVEGSNMWEFHGCDQTVVLTGRKRYRFSCEIRVARYRE